MSEGELPLEPMWLSKRHQLPNSSVPFPSAGSSPGLLPTPKPPEIQQPTAAPKSEPEVGAQQPSKRGSRRKEKQKPLLSLVSEGGKLFLAPTDPIPSGPTTGHRARQPPLSTRLLTPVTTTTTPPNPRLHSPPHSHRRHHEHFASNSMSFSPRVNIIKEPDPLPPNPTLSKSVDVPDASPPPPSPLDSVLPPACATDHEPAEELPEQSLLGRWLMVAPAQPQPQQADDPTVEPPTSPSRPTTWSKIASELRAPPTPPNSSASVQQQQQQHSPSPPSARPAPESPAPRLRSLASSPPSKATRKGPLSSAGVTVRPIAAAVDSKPAALSSPKPQQFISLSASRPSDARKEQQSEAMSEQKKAELAKAIAESEKAQAKMDFLKGLRSKNKAPSKSAQQPKAASSSKGTTPGPQDSASTATAATHDTAEGEDLQPSEAEEKLLRQLGWTPEGADACPLMPEEATWFQTKVEELRASGKLSPEDDVGMRGQRTVSLLDIRVSPRLRRTSKLFSQTSPLSDHAAPARSRGRSLNSYFELSSSECSSEDDGH